MHSTLAHIGKKVSLALSGDLALATTVAVTTGTIVIKVSTVLFLSPAIRFKLLGKPLRYLPQTLGKKNKTDSTLRGHLSVLTQQRFFPMREAGR